MSHIHTQTKARAQRVSFTSMMRSRTAHRGSWEMGASQHATHVYTRPRWQRITPRLCIRATRSSSREQGAIDFLTGGGTRWIPMTRIPSQGRPSWGRPLRSKLGG